MLVAVLFPKQVGAINPKNIKIKNGVSISPFIQNVSLNQNQNEKHFEVTITNKTNSLKEVHLSARDFGSLDETGGLLLEGSGNYSKKYGLASWLVLGTNTVVLHPKEAKSIPIVINNRSSLQPGGHYAAIVASINAPDTLTGNEVAVNQQLMSLVLVNKNGGESYGLKLADISHNGNWANLPSTVKLRFQNPGNVHIVPRGTVLLKDVKGSIIAKGLINVESSYVLPETFRGIEVPLHKVGNGFRAPGLYKLEVSYRYDEIDKMAQKSQSILFVNMKFWVGVLLLAFLARITLRLKQK